MGFRVYEIKMDSNNTAPEGKQAPTQTISSPIGADYLEKFDAILAHIRLTKPRFKKVDLLRYWIDKEFEALNTGKKSND